MNNEFLLRDADEIIGKLIAAGTGVSDNAFPNPASMTSEERLDSALSKWEETVSEARKLRQKLQ